MAREDALRTIAPDRSGDEKERKTPPRRIDRREAKRKNDERAPADTVTRPIVRSGRASRPDQPCNGLVAGQ
jgi:hypothetical protein